MLRVYAESFVQMGKLFLHSQMIGDLATGGLIIGGGQAKNTRLNRQAQEFILQNLKALVFYCGTLELHTSHALVTQSIEKFEKHTPTVGEVGTEMEFLERSVTSELKNRLFFFIPTERSKFHRATLVTKDDFESFPVNLVFLEKFPESLQDVTAACNCYASGEAAASVFHSMRVAELGLRALAQEVGVSFPVDYEQWKVIIDQIEAAIKALQQQPRSQQRNDQLERFSKAASQFFYFKEAWRNHVSHARSFYSDTEAKDILRAVETLMVHLAS